MAVDHLKLNKTMYEKIHFSSSQRFHSDAMCNAQNHNRCNVIDVSRKAITSREPFNDCSPPQCGFIQLITIPLS